MIRFPLRYAAGNILIGPSGEAAALYRVQTTSYPHLTAGDKQALAARLVRFAHVVAADFSIWRVQRAYPASQYVAELEGLVDERHAGPGSWREFLQDHEKRLAESSSHLPEVYLAITLTATGKSVLGQGVISSFDRARRRLEQLFRVDQPRPISGGDLKKLAESERRTFDRIGGVLDFRRARTSEIQWLLRRGGTRGVTEPALDPHWQPDALVVETPDGLTTYEPLEHDLIRCVNEPMTEDPAEPASLMVEPEPGTGYQAFLCLGTLASEAVFPGEQAELLSAPAEAVGFPVDAVIHARWIGNRDALAQVRKRILDVEHAYREQEKGSVAGPGFMAAEDRELAREYEAILQGTSHPPMLKASVSFAVGAPDRSELERRVDALSERFGDVPLHRPRGLQHQLFLEHVPRVGSEVADYEQQMTVEQFGAMVVTASTDLGSDTGTYIGTSPAGGGRPVRYDPTEASRTARASAVLLAGTLGSGKTLTAQAIAFGAERRGSLVVDFDPKPDHALDQVPELAGSVEVLELSGEEANRGRLDPMAIGLPELREELASSYLLELLRDPAPAWENQVQRAVRDAIRASERNLGAVIARLKASEDTTAHEVSDALEVIADFGLARLGFGNGETVEPTSARSSVTTIRTPGLSLPDPGASRETYTRAERISVATLSLIAALALRLVSGDRSRHKVVLLDEAWFLLASTQGRMLLNRLVRLGRSANTTVLLASQRLADLGDLSELVGTYFLFGQESDSEAARALRLIGLDPDDGELLHSLKGFRQGRCLMRDLKGRVGELQVDLASDALLVALDTTPRREDEK